MLIILQVVDYVYLSYICQIYVTFLERNLPGWDINHVADQSRHIEFSGTLKLSLANKVTLIKILSIFSV